MSSGPEPVGDHGPPTAALTQVAGLAVLAGVFLWNGAAPHSGPSWRAGAAVLGLLLVGASLARQVPELLAGPEPRPFAAAGTWWLGAGACFVALLSLPERWGSLGVLFQLLAWASLSAGALTALPRWLRQPLLCLLITAHLAIVGCGLVNDPGPEDAPPYLPAQIQSRLTGPYLEALGLGRPLGSPGLAWRPPAAVWMRLRWSDGAAQWRRIPEEDGPRSQQRQRESALAAALLRPTSPAPPWLAELARRRVEAGERHTPPIPPAHGPLELQYREPTPEARILLASLVRRVARLATHPKSGAAALESVQVYAGEWASVPPEDLARGRSPADPTLLSVFYLGKFTPEGALLDPTGIEWEGARPRLGPQGRVIVRQDPFLYWRLPITRAPRRKREPDEPPPKMPPRELPAEGPLRNGMLDHAGDTEGPP